MNRTFAVTPETYDVLNDIAEERTRQDRLFGDQTGLPDVYPVNAGKPVNALAYHCLPTPETARELCEHARANGRISWAHILVGEVAEAVEAAAKGDLAELRTELIQVAAVAVAQVEALDQRATAILAPVAPIAKHPLRRWDVV